VGVLIDVDTGADGDALGDVLRAAGSAGSDERFGIGADMLTELVADGGQRAFLFELKKEFHGAERRGGEDDPTAGETPGPMVDKRCGLNGAHRVAGAAIGGGSQRLDVHHAGFGKDARSVLFGEIEVGKIQRIIGAIAATHHASAATGAGGSSWAFSAKKWIWKRLIAGLSLGGLKDAHSGAVESIPRARGFCGFLQELISGAEDPIFRDTQHARSGLVVLGHFRFPVG